jgi:hypothetical protein
MVYGSCVTLEALQPITSVEKADEMGLEEDNIRKYTTPAYRAPEMWDLYQRELINEKVDIWVIIIWSTTYPLPCID